MVESENRLPRQPPQRHPCHGLMPAQFITPSVVNIARRYLGGRPPLSDKSVLTVIYRNILADCGVAKGGVAGGGGGEVGRWRGGEVES
ncbi:hypothetical protein Tco_1434778, partial [Tanacetum coccineum]